MKFLQVIIFLLFLVMAFNVFIGIQDDDLSLTIFSSIIGGIFLYAFFYLPVLIHGNND